MAKREFGPPPRQFSVCDFTIGYIKRLAVQNFMAVTISEY
jgi:hypothetical protein